ncbi:MAG: butyrate kinase [Candidatus Wallbacteria bacterium]|nr:butyrate kinase [Candidatus Wallbacteria bacterium]
MKILVINPGSTSTKVAVFEDDKLLFDETLRHSSEQLKAFPDIFSQQDFRKKIIHDFLSKHNLKMSDFAGIAARGGPLPPSEGGTYIVDENLLFATRNLYVTEHPSLLAALIAADLGKEANLKSYIVDPVSVDEWHELSRFSGMPELPRISLSHALNMRAVARRTARDLGKKYEELNLIIIHLGGGISVSAHEKGRQIDANNANEDGPFSPERTGTLPVSPLVKLCFSGKYSLQKMKNLIVREGGMTAYLGINDVKEALKLADSGDQKARSVLDSMIYQVAKETGKMAVVLKGKIDAIAVSGGIAYNESLVKILRERIEFLGPVRVYPGEDEMEALALGTLRVLRGEEKAKNFACKADSIR